MLAPTKLRSAAPSCWDYFRGKAYYWLFGTQHTRYFSELIVRAFNWSKVLLFTFPNDLNEPLAWPFRYKDNQPIAKASFDQSFRIAALLWGAGMALWWFHSPLTHVARVQATTGLSSVVVRSLLFSEKFFSGFSGFPLSSKINISKFQFAWMQDFPENHFPRSEWSFLGKYQWLLIIIII